MGTLGGPPPADFSIVLRSIIIWNRIRAPSTNIALKANIMNVS